MKLQTLFKTLLLMLNAFLMQKLDAQCTGCTTTFTDNSVTNYTISSGQTLCIASNFTYTGNLTLSGGTLCNDGTITKVVFKSGTFNNNNGGVVSASSRSNLYFALNGNLVLNNYTGSLFSISDSLKISGGVSGDTLRLNLYEGSTISCNTLLFSSGTGVFNLGIAAITASLSSFVTGLNINGNGVFSGAQNIVVNQPGNLNVTGKLILKNTGIKQLVNYGTLSVSDSLNILGNGSSTSTITVNNYGDLSIYGTLNSSISNCTVNINSNADLSSTIFYVDQDLTMTGTNMHFTNNDVLQINGNINLNHGTLDNNFYMQAGTMNIDDGTATNDSLVFLSHDLNINQTDGVLNNNGKFTGIAFTNNGTINMGQRSVIMGESFDNTSTGQVIGPSTSDQSLYGRIFINSLTTNAGTLTGSLFFIDKTNTNPSGVDIPDGGFIGPNVATVYDCKFEPGYFYTGTSSYIRPRLTFCPGENIMVNFVSYYPITGSLTWSFTVSAGLIAYTSGGATAIINNLAGSGFAYVSGTFNNGWMDCNFTQGFYITVSNASITTASPSYFGVGNSIPLNSTVTVGSPPFSYTWTPNYFYVSPSTANSSHPQVAPQVSLIYTVNMADGYGCTASNTLEVIGEPFASLDKDLSGEYYTLFNNLLFFKHDSQYDFTNLNYYVYDKSRTVVASSSSGNLVNITSLNSGDNRLTLNATSLPTGYYVLEVINEKNEKSYLRFKR